MKGGVGNTTMSQQHKDKKRDIIKVKIQFSAINLCLGTKSIIKAIQAHRN